MLSAKKFTKLKNYRKFIVYSSSELGNRTRIWRHPRRCTHRCFRRGWYWNLRSFDGSSRVRQFPRGSASNRVLLS